MTSQHDQSQPHSADKDEGRYAPRLAAVDDGPPPGAEWSTGPIGHPRPMPHYVATPLPATPPPTSPTAPLEGWHGGPALDAYRAEAPVGLAPRVAAPARSVEVEVDPGSFVFRPGAHLLARPAAAREGWRGALNRALRLRIRMGEQELLVRHAASMVRSSFPAPRFITVAQPKGGAGKTPTCLVLTEVLASLRRESIVAWDTNGLRGTLGIRAGVQDPKNTVMDLLKSADHLARPGAAVGELAGFLRRQESGAMVLASSEDAGEMRTLTETQCGTVRDLLMSRYSTIVADTGNDEAAPTWQFATSHADVLVIPMPAKEDHLWAAGLMLDGLYQRQQTRQLPARAIVVVTDSRGSRFSEAEEQWLTGLAARGLLHRLMYVPADPEIVDGPIRFDRLSRASQQAWTLVAAAVAELCTQPSTHDADPTK